ncbi:MAG: Ig domain-containing protein [Balneolaceae bacterium]|nr:Ig domain-containing protein [Balneolaceae bacterium]
MYAYQAEYTKRALLRLPLLAGLMGCLLALHGAMQPLYAQPDLQKDYSFVMEIPSVLAMASSPAHVYILSETEGLVAFRTRPDSLQWLYTSNGMARRGNTMSADIRFAYLWGDSPRLTVLEPTSVLGVYSSTRLPERPRDAERIDRRLYAALGDGGVGWVSLQSASAVDSAFTRVEAGGLASAEVLDLESSGDRLYALSSGATLYRLNAGGENPQVEQEFALSEELQRIFLSGQTLMGTDAGGNIYEISGSGNLSRLGSIGEPVVKLETWGDWYLIQGATGRIWTSYRSRSPSPWKEDRDAGYAFTVTGGQLWLSEYSQVSRVVEGGVIASGAPEGEAADADSSGPLPGQLSLDSIPDQIVPYSKPVLLNFSLGQDFPSSQVQFAYQSSVDDAEVRGSSFYWQPGSGDVGTHRFKIVATASNGAADSTSFSVEVNSFNAPPRFSPLRTLAIPVGESFTLPVRAIDPDGMHRDLIRYLGVDLPDGASLGETSGDFMWTPSQRQTGEHNFRIIATDQYGAASSTEVTIRVLEAGDSDGN